jgi:hypothetical protein
MILGEINRTSGITTTLDDLFRRAGVRHPDSPALVDPPTRLRALSRFSESCAPA